MSLLGHILFFLIGSHITCSEYNCAHYFTIRIDTIILILLSFCTGKLHHSIFLYHCIDWFMNNQLSGINKCGVQTKIWSDIKTMRYKREIYLMWKKFQKVILNLQLCLSEVFQKSFLVDFTIRNFPNYEITCLRHL